MVINDDKNDNTYDIGLLFAYFRVYLICLSNYIYNLIYNNLVFLCYEKTNEYFLLKYNTKQCDFFFIYS